MSKCKKTKYATAISARAAAKRVGGKGEQREVEKCTQCQKWHIKDGVM